MGVAAVLFIVGITNTPSEPTETVPASSVTEAKNTSVSEQALDLSDSSKIDSTTEEFDEDTVVSQLAVTKYQYTDSIKTHWVVLVIKNNSNFNLDITVDLDLFDKSGKIIGTKEEEQEAFEKGSGIALTFMNEEAPASIKYEISAEPETMYDCVTSELSQKTVLGKEKAIVAVTNNGSQSAEFVEGTGLFFKGKTLVGIETTYFTDDNSKIKAGKTIKKEMMCYNAFDSVKVYLTGRR
jgi:hypothetical protein